jgi:molybdopterin molybdotransferase
MLTLDEAQQKLMAAIVPGEGTEHVALARGIGRYVAAPVHAVVDNPAFDNSAMDGYAAATADLRAAGGRLQLVGEASCGDAPGRLVPGTTMRIFTGAPLPIGADTVVMQEEVAREADEVRFPAIPEVGQYIRRRGEDFRAGEQLYRSGQRLRTHDLALLSAAGVVEVPVRPRPRALVVATGNELVAPGTPLQPGQIYESNRLATLLLLEAAGAEAVDGGTVRDEPAVLRTLLARAADYDFIVTSGGASVGDHDLVKQVFAEIGQIDFWRVKIKPGKPVAFGKVGGKTHFFSLPGNPVSSLVTFKLFVEPAIVAWHGASYRMPLVSAVAAADFSRRDAVRMEFLRARLSQDDAHLVAEVLRGQGSHQIGTMRQTNALLRIDADVTGFRKGDTVTIMPLGNSVDAA